MIRGGVDCVGCDDCDDCDDCDAFDACDVVVAVAVAVAVAAAAAPPRKSLLATQFTSALAHGVAVPQQHQRHRQHVHGTTAAMVDCVMHVWLNRSHPGCDRS